MPGARDLQDVAQHLIVNLLRDATHGCVDCFDHQHPVHVGALCLTRTVLYNQRQYVLIFQHLHHPTASSAELSTAMPQSAGGTLSADYVTDTDARYSALWLLVYSALNEGFGG